MTLTKLALAAALLAGLSSSAFAVSTTDIGDNKAFYIQPVAHEMNGAYAKARTHAHGYTAEEKWQFDRVTWSRW